MVEQENTVQVIHCPEWQDAKTLFHNTVFFFKIFCIYNYTSLVHSICLKACIGIKIVCSLILLLQSALQPLWVMACSTIIEYSRQEGFYRVPLPVAHQTPNLEDQ